MALTTHPDLSPRLKQEQSYTCTPLWVLVACSTLNFTFTCVILTDKEHFTCMCSFISRAFYSAKQLLAFVFPGRACPLSFVKYNRTTLLPNLAL